MLIWCVGIYIIIYGCFNISRHLSSSFIFFDSFDNTCSRDFNRFMVFVFEDIYLSNFDNRSAASERASVITSAVHSYLRSSYGGLPSIFYSSISSWSRDFIGCSRDFTLSTAISIWIYISRTWWNRSEAKRAQRASVPPSILTYGHPTEVGAPAGACFHSYGGGADLFFSPFSIAHHYSTPFIVSEFHRWTEMTHITLFQLYFISLYTTITPP